MAKGTDVNITQKFETSKDGFALLSKTRADIASQIPTSGNAEAVAQHPSVVAVKQALEQLDQIKLEKEQTMGEG